MLLVAEKDFAPSYRARRRHRQHKLPCSPRFLDTSERAEGAMTTCQQGSRVLVCASSSKRLFDGKMIEGMERGTRHPVLAADILRGVRDEVG